MSDNSEVVQHLQTGSERLTRPGQTAFAKTSNSCVNVPGARHCTITNPGRLRNRVFAKLPKVA